MFPQKISARKYCAFTLLNEEIVSVDQLSLADSNQGNPISRIERLCTKFPEGIFERTSFAAGPLDCLATHLVRSSNHNPRRPKGRQIRLPFLFPEWTLASGCHLEIVGVGHVAFDPQGGPSTHFVVGRTAACAEGSACKWHPHTLLKSSEPTVSNTSLVSNDRKLEREVTLDLVRIQDNPSLAGRHKPPLASHDAQACWKASELSTPAKN